MDRVPNRQDRNEKRASWAVVIALFFLALIYIVMVIIGVGGAVFSNEVTNPPQLQVPLSAIDLDAIDSNEVANAVSKGLEQEASGHSGTEVLLSITVDELDATAPRLVWSLSNALLNLGYAGLLILIAIAVSWSKSIPVFSSEFAKLETPALLVGITLILGVTVRSLSESWVTDAYGLPKAAVPDSGGTNPLDLFGPLVAVFFFFAAAVIWRQGTALQQLSDETV